MYKFYLLLGLAVACKSTTSKQNADSARVISSGDSSMSVVLNNYGKDVDEAKIDSFKWILYAASFRSDAIAGKEMPKLRPVQCSFSLWDIKFLGKDTARYMFNFYYKDPNVGYWLDPNDQYGVATIKGVKRYLFGGHWQMDIPATPGLSEKFFNKQDSLFRNYLKTYNGEMNDWLREEAIKRGVIEM